MLSFTGNPLDRASAERSDPNWIAAQQARADALFLPIWQTKPLLIGERAGFLPAGALDLTPEMLRVFLGLRDGQPLFAVAMADSESPPLAGLGEFRDMRAAAFVLSDADTAIAGQAKALIDWHHRHRFCANCGARDRARRWRLSPRLLPMRRRAFSPHRSGGDHAADCWARNA